jgi:hypothetical protein
VAAARGHGAARGALRAAAAFLASAALAGPATALDWDAYREDGVVEILTDDEDGARRETSVWCVVLEDAVFVRTNDSRWLANIRRGSPVALRARAVESAVSAEEVWDAPLRARVEEAYKAKYGSVQRVMSALRLREPTVLRLTPR